MRGVSMVGIGMTRFGRFLERGLKDLSQEAVAKALKDAGIGKEMIEAAFVGNSVAGLITGQETIRGQVMLGASDIGGIPIFNIENACASSSTAFHLGWSSIASGMHDCVLIVGAEKMTHEDRSRTFAAFESGLDIEAYAEILQEREQNHSVFMDIYAQNAMKFMEDSGARKEHFAMVAAKNHTNGSLNPYAQYQKSRTATEVLNAKSIIEPFTKLMCSPVSDGAVALILCSDRFSRRMNTRTVTVAATTVCSSLKNREDGQGVIERASRAAYEMAGIGPEDIQVVEIHDAAASAEMIAYEELGLCARGDAIKLVEEKTTSIDGRIPVNASGGLEAKGHSIGATGLGQIVELVWQLRGEAGARQIPGTPKIALAENAGGYLNNENAACTITILKSE